MPRPVTLFTGQFADLPFVEICRLASEWGYDAHQFTPEQIDEAFEASLNEPPGFTKAVGMSDGGTG